jgi:hypothetical protein
MNSTSYNKTYISYNQKGISNILINAKAYVTTQPPNSSNLQIANTQYVTDEVTILKETITNRFNEAMNAINVVKYIHVTENDITTASSYYILNSYNIVVDVVCDVYLPVSQLEGKIINIVNNSGFYVNINSQNNELMHSSLYLNPAGSMIFQAPPYKLLKFFNIQSNNLFSWIILS